MTRNLQTGPRRWRDLALCAETDPEVFFPDKGQTGRDAKRICAACPVTKPCLEFALAHGITWGIWGGLSGRERRQLRSGEVAA